MEDISISVVEINQVCRGHAQRTNGSVVVVDLMLRAKKCDWYPSLVGRLINHVLQPRRRVLGRGQCSDPQSPIMSASRNALIFLIVPSFCHFAARCRVP